MQTRNETAVQYVGGGIGVGAALGLLFGLMLSADLPLLLVAGAAIGLIVGAIPSVRRTSASR